MSTLRITTLGRCELRRLLPNGSDELVPLSGKPLGLLVRIASAREQLLSRDVLASELWSGLERERAHAQFRTALWTIRKHLPPDAIHADDATVVLAAPVAIDRNEFQAAVRSTDFTTATALYRGDFLAHFAMSGADGFEEWVELERRNLRGLFLGAAVAEARRLTFNARFADAVALAARARHAEPFDQRGWRALLQALISGGDLVSARNEASAFLSFHDAEQFSIDPETTRLLRQASASVPAAPDLDGAPGLEAELVGREQELAGLLKLVERAKRGHPLSASVIGPPGIGKTRLVRDFGRSATAHRATVVTVSAPRATQRVPYDTVARLAEQLAVLRGGLGVSGASAAVLVGLHPALSAVYRSVTPQATPADRGTRLLALVELVKSVAEEAPLVLVVDDTQWLDDASRELICALPESCSGAAMLLVLSTRGPAPADVVVSSTFTLAPFSPDLTESMVGSIARLSDDVWSVRWLRALHDAARGIPLGVLDVTRLGVERGCVAIEDGAWRCVDPDALLRLTEGAAPQEARIAQLPQLARELAVTLALAGGPIDDVIAAAVLDVSTDALFPAAQLLVERGIGYVAGRTLSLAHDEYSAAASASVAPDERRRVRARIATQLATLDDSGSLRRAYSLTEEADADELANEIAERYIALARRRVPRLDSRAAMAELIGIGTHATRLEELVRRHDRSGRKRRTMIGAATATAVVAGVVVAAPLFSSGTPLPDAMATVDMRTGDSHVVVGVPIMLGDWSTSRPIRVDARQGYRMGTAAMRGLTRSPTDTGVWVAVESRDDRLTDDIVVLRRDAPPRYLGSSRGDDVSPVWSPDGRRVGFITSRWTGDRGDVALADLSTDSVTRVPGLRGRLDLLVFRADGAGIVVLRYDERTLTREVCAIRLAETAPRCRQIGVAQAVTSLAWPTPSTVYFASPDPSGPAYVRAWDLAMDSVKVVAACLSTAVDVDALGQFVICSGHDRSSGFSIAPLARPDQMRRVELVGVPPDGAGGLSVVTLRRPRALAPLRLMPTHDALAGVAHVLRVVRPGAEGTEPEPVSVAWSLLTGDATVTEGGVLLARNPGVVTLVASDGLARDTLSVAVRSGVDSLLFDERWSAGWQARWISFGVPRPEVVDARGTKAFWNAGDGRYFSGAYSAVEWDATSGLAAEFELSTPLTADTSQLIRIGLRSGGDSAVMSTWDHKTGYGPGLARQRWCKFQYPTGDQAPHRSKYSGEVGERPAFESMWRGVPYRVRIQLFPDGRCGVALNGKVIGMTAEAGAEPTARVYVDGSSVKTKILLFGTTIRRGVPAGVDWPAPKRE